MLLESRMIPDKPLNTKMALVVDHVVVMETDVGVMPTASIMEIAVVISTVSVDLVTVIVMDTVVPDAGAMISVPVMVIAVLITPCYVPKKVNNKKDLTMSLLTKELETMKENQLKKKDLINTRNPLKTKLKILKPEDMMLNLEKTLNTNDLNLVPKKL
jgi:hypothetical protein